MQKAQIIGEAFIYIMASLLFILILMFGYKAIQMIMDHQEQIAVIDMQTTLQSAVDRIMLSYKSVQKLSLRVPTQYTTVCIATDPKLNNAEDEIEYLLFQQKYRGGENLLLSPLPKNVELSIANVEVRNIDTTLAHLPNKHYCCMRNTGILELRLEGGGDRTLLQPWDTTTTPCLLSP